MDNRYKRDDGMSENVIAIDRVARVVKGGRRFRFRALVVVGDGKTSLGIGISKSTDIQGAIQKAVAIAKKNMVSVSIDQGTIPHQVQAKHSGSIVLLKPAAPGTGLIAGGTVRSVIEVINIDNILSKSMGSSNKINVAYATLQALQSLVAKKDWHGAEDKANKDKLATKKTTKKAPVKKAAAKKPAAKKPAAKKKAPAKEKK